MEVDYIEDRIHEHDDAHNYDDVLTDSEVSDINENIFDTFFETFSVRLTMTPLWYEENGRIYACRNIPRGTYIGDIEGTVYYIDDFKGDISGPGVIFLDPDYFIDARQCILGRMSEANIDDPEVNCELYTNEEEGHIGIVSMHNILIGEELVFYNPI